MTEGNPQILEKNFMRHDPVMIRLLSPVEFSQPGRILQSRFVESRGMFFEIVPPLGPVHPFDLSTPIECMIQFQQGHSFIKFKGKVTRVMEHVQYENSKPFSLVGVKFENLSYEAKEALKAHDLAVSSKFSNERSARLPVSFEVEPTGIDVMSSLIAVDLSMTGMFVSGRAKFRVGKELQLNFRLPFQKERVSLRGRVVWTGEKIHPSTNQEISGFGLAFMEMENDTRMALASYYAKASI